ncbi:MAG: hypothetical protein CM1200mP2_48120 [Planctomycetaceae bacterium]|nr:MAG: hypothetical protein CM1200mP2_48120 [Planctomycetaceae bacterium]
MIRNALMTSLFLAIVMISPATRAADEVFIQKPEVVPVEVRGAKAATPKTTKKKTASKTLDIKSGPKARWIWGRKPARAKDRYYFRRTFTATTRQAKIIASCDNHLVVWINGKRLLAGERLERPGHRRHPAAPAAGQERDRNRRPQRRRSGRPGRETGLPRYREQDIGHRQRQELASGHIARLQDLDGRNGPGCHGRRTVGQCLRRRWTRRNQPRPVPGFARFPD